MTSSFKVLGNDLNYKEEDILNSAHPRAVIEDNIIYNIVDIGLSPIYYINNGITTGFTSSQKIILPKFDFTPVHWAVITFRLTETSTKGTSTTSYSAAEGLDQPNWRGLMWEWNEVTIDYSGRLPTTDGESIDVKIDFIDKDNKQIYENISQAYTVIPKDSKLQDISFRYVDFGNAYQKAIVCDFARDSRMDTYNAIKSFSESSSTIQFKFDQIEHSAKDFEFKKDWKSESNILKEVAIVDFAYQGLDLSDDYLKAEGDSVSHDLFSGNSGDDRIICMRGHDIAHGGKGNDFIGLGNGADIGYGGQGEDIIHGGFGRNTIYNMADKEIDLITFKSDEWASNHIYGNTRGNQDGSKLDKIIGGDSHDKYRIIYDDDVKPEFTYIDNIALEVSGISYKGTAIYLGGTLEAYVLDNGNLSDFSHINDVDTTCVEFSFSGT